MHKERHNAPGDRRVAIRTAPQSKRSPFAAENRVPTGHRWNGHGLRRATSKDMRLPGRGAIARGRARRADKPVAGGLKAFFPKLANPRNRFGLGVLLALAQREGGGVSIRYAAIEEAFQKPGQRPKSALLARVEAKTLAGILSGLSHADRIRVASAIMTGANTHRLLKEALGLKTGPLYHHIRGLRMSGLVTLASRNFYVLTDLGEAALLVVTGLAVQAGRDGKTWKTTSLGTR